MAYGGQVDLEDGLLRHGVELRLHALSGDKMVDDVYAATDAGDPVGIAQVEREELRACRADVPGPGHASAGTRLRWVAHLHPLR